MPGSGKKVKVIPLGGVDEVGKNMTLVEHQGRILVIDCGVGFPSEDMMGIDLLIPNTAYLEDKVDRIEGIVITHGHEDHIGSIPYLLPKLRAPIYATRLTLGLIRERLKEAGMLRYAQLVEMEPRRVLNLGPFRVEPFHVCHSIPDAVGLAIHTSVGTIVHSGDFKFDHTPVDGQPTDFGKLAELGSQGVLALLSDCVHVESSGHTPSERVVGQTLDRIFAEAPGRVIIATFASLISRVQQVIDAAANHGRKVAVVGRSLENNVQMALEMGYLSAPRGVLLPIGEVTRLAPRQVVFVVTGAQGEPMSVLSRIASQDHRQIKVMPGDTVIISATPIPGNETMVARVINNLFRLGADVIYQTLQTVHVSGHASQEELKLLLGLVKPRFVVPMHGEYRHLALYSKLARDVGVPQERILIVENGQVLELSADEARIAGRVPAGHVYVDGVTVGDGAQVVLRDRQRLARDGLLIIVVGLERETGKIVAGPDVISRGFMYLTEAEELIELTKEQVRRALAHDGLAHGEWSYVQRKVKDSVADLLYRHTKRRPMILPILMEV
jgi:ribonuclease J